MGRKMKQQPDFFEFAAEVGLTKHLGGIVSTKALIDLCHISKGKYVLDVGCGVGVTPCYIAKRYGCRVVGVDISERMIERSKERARRAMLADIIEFKVADAQDLPFEDALFNVVITESVTSFPEDKKKAIGEYVRVTKPGGYVGLNESIWRKVPPPPEVVAWASQDIGANVQPLTSDAWVGLLQSAGLKEITVRTFAVNPRGEVRGILRRYGLGGMLRVLWRMRLLYARSPAYRSFVKGVRETGLMPENLDQYFGYGLFVGQK
jgi:arsenite methyltransferase